MCHAPSAPHGPSACFHKIGVRLCVCIGASKHVCFCVRMYIRIDMKVNMNTDMNLGMYMSENMIRRMDMCTDMNANIYRSRAREPFSGLINNNNLINNTSPQHSLAIAL